MIGAVHPVSLVCEMPSLPGSVTGTLTREEPLMDPKKILETETGVRGDECTGLEKQAEKPSLDGLVICSMIL